MGLRQGLDLWRRIRARNPTHRQGRRRCGRCRRQQLWRDRRAWIRQQASGIDGPVSGSSSDGIAWGSSDFVGLGDGAADLVGDGAADLVGAAVADGFGDDVALGEEEGFADEALGDGEAGFFVVVDGDAEDLLEEEVVFFGLREDVEDEVDVDDDVRVAVGVFIGDAEVVADGWTTGTTSAGSISGAMGNLTNWSLTNSASEFAVAMSRLS